jgi:acyl-CoA reductase-like NAD-dependent aldehyde dehydrogenase
MLLNWPYYIIDARFRERSSDMLRALDAGLAYVGERESAGFGEELVVEDPSTGVPIFADQGQSLLDHPLDPVARDEIFGSVLTILEFTDEADAISLANGSPFGLVVGLWMADLARAHRVAGAVRAGQVIVNNCGVAGGVEPALGGYGQGGFGRLKSIDGALTYTQTENVRVAL